MVDANTTATAVTINDILQEIEKMAGVDSKTLPLLQRQSWFPPPGMQGPATVFSFSQPSPIGGDKGYRIWGMFRRDEEEEVSVYLLWGGSETKDNKPVPPMRYVLDMAVGNYAAEAMSFDRWKEEYAGELAALASEIKTPLQEREAICAYLSSALEEEGLAANTVETLKALVEEIDDGAHLEDGGDEEEALPPPNGAAPDAKSTPAPSAG